MCWGERERTIMAKCSLLNLGGICGYYLYWFFFFNFICMNTFKIKTWRKRENKF